MPLFVAFDISKTETETTFFKLFLAMRSPESLLLLSVLLAIDENLEAGSIIPVAEVLLCLSVYPNVLQREAYVVDVPGRCVIGLDRIRLAIVGEVEGDEMSTTAKAYV